VTVEDAPEILPEVPTPPVSPLFAMASAGPRLGRGWLIGIGALGTLVLGLIVFTLLCSGTFFLPQNTLAFATVAPKTLNALLTPEQLQTLPSEWQETLHTNSRWPVIFGLAGERTRLQAFALGPRWTVPAPLLQTTDTQTRAIIREVGLGGAPTTEPLVYRELFFTHVFGKGSPQGWIESSLLFPNASSSQRTVFSVQHGTLVLPETSEQPNSQTSAQLNPSVVPTQADLSLNLAALGEQTNIETFLGELPLAPIQTTLTSLHETPTSLEVRFNSSTLEALRLTFKDPPSANERAALFSVLNGTHKQQLLGLPDGTLVTEHLADPLPAASSFSDASSSTLLWQASQETSPLTDAVPCSQGVWIARLSPSILSRFAPLHSLLSPWIPKQALQVWRTKNGLVVCHEGEKISLAYTQHNLARLSEY
jgi:hypothetical protein